MQGRLTNEPEKEEYPKLKKSKIIIALNGSAKYNYAAKGRTALIKPFNAFRIKGSGYFTKERGNGTNR